MIVNLGCGDDPCHAYAPWVNVDSWEGANPDVLASVTFLPFEDGSCEQVYCGHILEHLDYDEQVPMMLAEVKRILAPYGSACFVGPDHDRANAENASPEQLHEIIHGNHDRPGAEHKWLSTAKTNMQAIERVFPDAWEVDILALSEHWPVVARVTWQFAILSS